MISPGTNSPRRFFSWFGSQSVAVIVLSLAAPLFSGPTPQLLLPGMFHGGEVVVENGSRWLAIVPQRGHGYAIEEAEVVVETVYDPIVDADGEMTGLMVTAPSCFRTPLFLVRGIESIQTGWFDTASSVQLPLRISEPFPIKVFSQRRYALLIEYDPNAPTTVDNFVECPLVLFHELSRQVLTTFSVYAPPGGDLSIGDEAVPQVLWAGDIDRDGNVDLLLDLSNHYNVSKPTLFLSSEAAGDQLVAEVASLVITGC